MTIIPSNMKKEYVFEFQKYEGLLEDTGLWGTTSFPVKSIYPVNIEQLDIETVKALVNTSIEIDVKEFDTKTREIIGFNINVKHDDDYQEGTSQYVLITQELIDESSKQFIWISSFNDKLLHIGHMDFEIIGFIPLPHKVYLLRIIEDV